MSSPYCTRLGVGAADHLDQAEEGRAVKRAISVCAAFVLFLVGCGAAAAAEPAEGRWAVNPFACGGEAFARPDTPLIVGPRSVHWFDANCVIASNYKVNQTL